MASTSKTSCKITGYLKKIIGFPIGELFSLTSGEVIIGRNRQSAEICIQDPNISRSHCVLKYSQNGWFIKDLKSVNGTFLDGKNLDPEILYPLKDGAGIYLGPPGEALVAFIFLTKMPNEQSNEINMNDCSQRNRGGTTNKQIQLSNKSNKCMKRPCDPEVSTTNKRFSQRKKNAISSSSPAISLGLQDLSEVMEDNGNLSDSSISSLDSLKTRVRKMSARKEKSGKSRNKGTINAASTSASPQLRSSSNASLESKPSTSAIPSEVLDRKRNKVQKPAIPKEFLLLNAILNDSESSTAETIKEEEDSQSILNDSKILMDCEPYPFSQPLPAETAQKKEKNENNTELEKGDSVEEQLQKATLELKKLKKDKLYMSRLVKELRSEEVSKKKFQGEFHKLLEDELMCNICTEVFVKAITLGCSHTFCEYCICEWKKKQKRCPICREKITSETNILVLDSFIKKGVEQLDIETQNKRKELLSTREKAKATQQKKRKRSRGRGRVNTRQVRSDGTNVIQLDSIGERIFNELFHPYNSRPVEASHAEEVDSISSSDFSDLSGESDISVEGHGGYYGGYGRCYTCGRRGHWTNGCPHV